MQTIYDEKNVGDILLVCTDDRTRPGGSRGESIESGQRAETFVVPGEVQEGQGSPKQDVVAIGLNVVARICGERDNLFKPFRRLERLVVGER
jgi:hypothetical protein